MGDRAASGDGSRFLTESVADTVALGPGDLLGAGSGDHRKGLPVLVVDVELAFLDVEGAQGVPVGEADTQRLSGDLGDATAGDAPLHLQRSGGDRPVGA